MINSSLNIISLAHVNTHDVRQEGRNENTQHPAKKAENKITPYTAAPTQPAKPRHVSVGLEAMANYYISLRSLNALTFSI